MKTAIIGLPSVGKSLLFQLLTGAATTPGGRTGPRVGIARVPDPRVDALAAMFRPRKATHATVEYVDVPGVSKGEGKALVDLPALRAIDALVHVVRAFESATVAHPDGSVDPLRDAQMVELELILADLGTVERRLERLDSNIKKAHRKEDVAERAIFERLKIHLESGRPLRELELSEPEKKSLCGYSLLSEKPVLLVANLDEGRVGEATAALEASGLVGFAARPGFALTAVSAPIEAEIAQLRPEDAAAFLEDLGLEASGLERLVRCSYALLGLISFLTVGDDECRAWTVRRGTRAQQAAGVVHTDIERGFIRAEVVPFAELVSAQSLAACRERGTLRLEGKDYLVRDGDVIHFRFNV